MKLVLVPSVSWSLSLDLDIDAHLHVDVIYDIMIAMPHAWRCHRDYRIWNNQNNNNYLTMQTASGHSGNIANVCTLAYIHSFITASRIRTTSAKALHCK